MSEFIHPEYQDHSLPTVLSPDAEGMKRWIMAMGQSFEHYTQIEDQITEGAKSVIKIRMRLKHIGE